MIKIIILRKILVLLEGFIRFTDILDCITSDGLKRTAKKLNINENSVCSKVFKEKCVEYDKISGLFGVHVFTFITLFTVIFLLRKLINDSISNFLWERFSAQTYSLSWLFGVSMLYVFLLLIRVRVMLFRISKGYYGDNENEVREIIEYIEDNKKDLGGGKSLELFTEVEKEEFIRGIEGVAVNGQ